MRADEINDRESFKAWLDARPEATRRSEVLALAHRAAMRTAMRLHRVGTVSLSHRAEFLTSAFRCNAISRVAAVYPTREIASAAAAAGSAAFAAGSAAIAASFAADAFAAAAAAFAAGSAVSAASVPAASATLAAVSAVPAVSAASEPAAFAAWEEIRADASALESDVTVSEVMATPLWRAPPAWWEKERVAFRQDLHGLDLPNHSFAIWTEWYDDVASGKPVFGIGSKEIRTTLERNIALGSTDGTFNKAFWERDPPKINADVARWVEEARQLDGVSKRSTEIALSSHPDDGVNALELYPVLQELGYRPRSMSEISIRKSKLKLASTFFPPRFIALLSENYFSSAVTVDEWNLARSEYRTIVPNCFVAALIRPVALPPDVRAMAPIPLYDRSAEEAREDLRRALSFDQVFVSAQQARQAARGAATHRGIRNQNGQWDVERTPDDLKPFIDSDILKLPQNVQKLAEILIKSLGHQNSNAPGFVVDYLRECVSEIKNKGPTFDASDVKSWVNLFELEVTGCADEGWVQKHRNPINEFLAQHSKLHQHYPAILSREYLALQSQIDPEVFDDPEFATRLENLRKAAQASQQRGEITEQFLSEVESSYKKLHALVVFGQAVPGHGKRLLSNTGELSLSVLRKKEAFEKGGTMDRIGNDMKEVARGAGGEVAGALIMKALESFAKYIFGG